MVTLKKLRQIDGMEDGRREGGAWTDTAPEMDGASEIPDGASERLNGVASKRKRRRGKRKEGGL